jgi:putative membrane protein
MIGWFQLKFAALVLVLQAAASAFSSSSFCVNRRAALRQKSYSFKEKKLSNYYLMTNEAADLFPGPDLITSRDNISSPTVLFSKSDRPQEIIDSSTKTKCSTVDSLNVALFAAIGLAIFLMLAPAEYALAVEFPFSSTTASSLLSALTIYGHILGLLLAATSLTAERLLVKADMSLEEEAQLTAAHVVFGVANILITVSGYYLILNGKGWEFYSHEPLFWFKLTLYAIMVSSSFFPTIKILQRYLDRGTIPPPMSNKLANRIIKVVDSELSALASIPLIATFMSRGIAYVDYFPWQAAGAVPLLAVFVGLGFTYIKEALVWSED